MRELGLSKPKAKAARDRSNLKQILFLACLQERICPSEILPGITKPSNVVCIAWVGESALVWTQAKIHDFMG